MSKLVIKINDLMILSFKYGICNKWVRRKDLY